MPVYQAWVQFVEFTYFKNRFELALKASITKGA